MILRKSLSSVHFIVSLLFIWAWLTPIHASAQTLAAHWMFDESSGNRAFDAASSAHTASLVNGVSWVPGKVGGAVSANSTLSQYVSIPAVDVRSTRSITLTFWSKRTYSTAGGHALVEATADYTQSTTGFALLPDDEACQGIRAALNGDVGETANCYGQPSSGIWHHLAVVFDKTQSAGNQVALYVDGALQNPSRSLAASTNTNYFGNDPIYLFSRGGAKWFDSGRIDDLRVYASALSPKQVQQIYNSGLTQISEDFRVSVDSYGKMTTPSFTTSADGELLVAFMASDIKILLLGSLNGVWSTLEAKSPI